MHPEFITHREEQLALGHLNQFLGEFEWTPKGGQPNRYRVRVRYSNHCYSRKLEDGEELLADDVVVDTGPLRVFCRERYNLTTTLCRTINGLFAKPTTAVFLTHESNWTIYQFYARVPGQPQPYRVFFTVRRGNSPDMVDGAHRLEMYVQSAYPKESLVGTKRKALFGTVADMTIRGEPYF